MSNMCANLTQLAAQTKLISNSTRSSIRYPAQSNTLRAFASHTCSGGLCFFTHLQLYFPFHVHVNTNFRSQPAIWHIASRVLGASTREAERECHVDAGAERGCHVNSNMCGRYPAAARPARFFFETSRDPATANAVVGQTQQAKAQKMPCAALHDALRCCLLVLALGTRCKMPHLPGEFGHGSVLPHASHADGHHEHYRVLIHHVVDVRV